MEDQRKALIAAGVSSEGDHPSIYIDMISERTRKTQGGPLPERAAAIHSLRDGDAIVVYDAAALGQTPDDIMEALAAAGERDAMVVVCVPPGEFCWHPDIPTAMGLVADGGKILDRERRRARAGSGPIIGRPKKLTGKALILARILWSRRDLVSKQVAAEIKKQTGVDVGVRTLIKNLGHKTDAVERAERKLR